MGVRNDIFAKLLIAAQSLKGDGYPIRVSKIVEYEPNVLSDSARALVAILDAGNDTLITEDATDQQYGCDVDFYALVDANKWEDARRDVNDVAESIKIFLDGEPNLGPNALSIRFAEGYLSQRDPKTNKAALGIRSRLIYYRTKSTSGAAGTSEYGTGWIGAARDKVYDQIDALKTVMASYDPKFSYVYKQHRKARIELNAFTVDLSVADSNEGNRAFDGGAGTQVVTWTVTLSVRCHTAYAGAPFDSQKTIRLMTSAVNYLKENYDLGDGYRVDDIPVVVTNQEFAESGTMGGEITVVVSKTISH